MPVCANVVLTNVSLQRGVHRALRYSIQEFVIESYCLHLQDRKLPLWVPTIIRDISLFPFLIAVSVILPDTTY